MLNVNGEAVDECQTTKRSESVEVRWPVRLFRSQFDKDELIECFSDE